MSACTNERICVQVLLGDYSPGLSSISAHFWSRGTSYQKNCLFRDVWIVNSSGRVRWDRPPEQREISRKIKRTCPSRDKDRSGLVLRRVQFPTCRVPLMCWSRQVPSVWLNGTGTGPGMVQTLTRWHSYSVSSNHPLSLPRSLLCSAGIHAMATNPLLGLQAGENPDSSQFLTCLCSSMAVYNYANMETNVKERLWD